MRCARSGQRALAAACLLALVGAGCTPSAPPTSTPTPAASTPTETAQEREERLAYEAAEKSYREFRAEFDRVLKAGGSKQATDQMRATAESSYLKEETEIVQAYHGLQYRDEGTDKIEWVRQSGYTPTEVLLTTCENASAVTTLSRAGKIVGRGDIRVLDLKVRLSDSGNWMVSSGSGKKVDSCDA